MYGALSGERLVILGPINLVPCECRRRKVNEVQALHYILAEQKKTLGVIVEQKITTEYK